jgi:ATP-dependent DNA helicase
MNNININRLKNRNCKLIKALKTMPSAMRLLLSGTPIQNSLEELWSLLNFCSPNIFSDIDAFKAWFGFKVWK